MPREIRLAAVPSGLPRPADFAVARTPVPEPGPGELLVRNRYFQVSAALRTLVGGALDGAPLPAIKPGEALIGPAIGEVVAGPRAGELVAHWQGWREYAAVQGAFLDGPLPDPAAHLAPSWTAYAALARDGALRPGETVLVTGGAGAVGSLAGQIARLLGAGRVVGSTGSAAKAERMRAELGYDAVLVRGAGPIGEQLATAAPDGLDVVVDNVGGEQLRAAVAAARPDARIVLVGSLSGQMAPDGAGASAPVGLDSFELILKRLVLRGFGGPGTPDELAAWTGRFGAWLRSGELAFPHTVVKGLENGPRALQELIEGRHLGSVVVEL